MKQQRRFSRPLYGLIGLGIVAVFYGIVRSLDTDKPFDRSVWLAHPHEYRDDNPRLNMANDLLAHHLPVGLSQKQVTALLGEPDQKSEQGMYIYLVGARMIDASNVYVQFDNTGKLGKAWWVDGG